MHRRICRGVRKLRTLVAQRTGGKNNVLRNVWKEDDEEGIQEDSQEEEEVMSD
jgi:hypothetical protein